MPPRSQLCPFEQLEAAVPVAARFFVRSVEEYPGSTASNVILGAVCRGAHNAQWSSATPSGQIQMSIRNDLATAQFIQGKEYEVIFREVQPPQPGDGHAVRRYVGSGNYVSCGECGAVPKVADGIPWGPTGDLPEDQLDWTAHDQAYGGTS